MKIECMAIKQDGNKCTNKVSSRCGNKFCEKHITEWKEHQQTGGEDVRRCNSRYRCDPNNPGLKAILPDGYTKNKCERCLERERNRDHLRRDKTVERNNETVDKQYCVKCQNEIPLENVVITKLGQPSPYCWRCFEQRQKIEAKRGHRERDYTKYENRPERKIAKAVWRKENPDKAYAYYTKYRAKKLNEDSEKYHRRCAENARRWRENNWRKIKLMRSLAKTRPELAYTLYAYRAGRDGYNLEIDIDEFAKLVNGECYYCHVPRGKFLLGIDRLDNSIGYAKGNIVACCKMCNMMKNTLNEATFILMCAHIAGYHCTLWYGSYPFVFHNYYGSSYSKYKYRASTKQIEFEISKDELENIIHNQPCYICGRYVDNGIDRFDNSKGYTVENCRPCCGNCNYLKKDLNFDLFILKCTLVSYNHNNRIKKLVNTWTPSKFLEFNKQKKRLTDEEKMKIRKERARLRHEKTMSTKTDQAIKKRMEEIRKERMEKLGST